MIDEWIDWSKRNPKCALSSLLKRKRASIVSVFLCCSQCVVSRAIIAGDWVGGRVSDGGRVNKTRKVAFLTRTRSSRSVMISVLYVRYKPPYHPQKTRVKPPEVMRTDDIQKDILGQKYGYLLFVQYGVSCIDRHGSRRKWELWQIRQVVEQFCFVSCGAIILWIRMFNVVVVVQCTIVRHIMIHPNKNLSSQIDGSMDQIVVR